MTGSRYILLVEDQPDDAALARRALANIGFAGELVVAHDGIEAIDYLAGSSSRVTGDAANMPAVVLLDLQLPRIDGFEVLRRIRAHGKTSLLPIVVLTSSRDARDIAEAYRLGANSYVVKPVGFEHFSSVIAQIARYWLTLNQPVDGGTRV